MSNKRSSNSIPWLSDYVLQQLPVKRHSDGGDGRLSVSLSSSPKKLVQILSRGGTFWQSCQVTDDAWMVVTDGEHSIVAHLTIPCRRSILEETQTGPPGDMRFINYARGSVGLLESYTFQSSPIMALMVQKWIAKPGLQGMIAPNIVIQPIDEHIPVRQVIQQQQQSHANQKLVLASAQEAIDDPALFEELVRIALEAAQDQGEQDEDMEKQEMERVVGVDKESRATTERVSGDSGASEDDSSDDEDKEDDTDKEMSMSLKDMLATQPSPARPVRMQPKPPTPRLATSRESRTKHSTLVDASTQTSPLHETLLSPVPLPMQQPMTRETTTPINNTTPKRKRMTPMGGSQGKTSSLWDRFKEQLEDPNCLMIDVKLPSRPRPLPFRLSRWLHQNLVEQSPSLLQMPPRPKGRLAGVPTVTFH